MLSKKYFTRTVLLGFLALFVFMTTGIPMAEGKDVDPRLKFYKGKVVRLIVSTKPGGGYDTYARVAVQYMKKYMPDCTIIIKNIPGAGHIIGTNDLYRSKPNGLTFGMGNHKGLLFAQLAGRKGIRFDLRKMSWLANVAGETQVLIVRKALPYKTIDELKTATTPIRMGASGVGSSSYNFTLMVRHIMGINFKMSPGYSGSEADIAMIRGELDGQVGAFDNLRSIVENGDARVVLMIGTKRLPQFPDVPMMKDYATPKNQGLINLMHAMVDLGRPIAAPPKMPPDRLAALRQLIEKTFKDPGLLAHAKKIKIPIVYTSGEETRKMFVEALDQPPEVVNLVKEMAKPIR